MRTIGREARKTVSDMESMKVKLEAVCAENESLKKKIKKLEADKKKAEQAETQNKEAAETAEKDGK